MKRNFTDRTKQCGYRDNPPALRANGVLDVIQYLERLPDKLIPKKAELVEELKRNAEEGGNGQLTMEN